MLALVAGGAASGKSAYAERLAVQLGGRKCYLATMEPYGEEAQQRIQKHRLARREKGFDTVEVYTGLARRAQGLCYDTVLLECMTNLLANEMYAPDGAGQQAALAALQEGVLALQKAVPQVVIVSGDLFCEGTDYGPLTGRYLQYLGQINCWLAQQADVVVELVCGIPVVHRQNEKGRALLEKMG